MSYINLKRYFVIVLSIVMLSGIFFFGLSQQTQATERHSQSKNYVDSRYQHNRSYPVRGQSVRSLPRDHRVVIHGNSRYYSSRGVWYRPYRGQYVVFAPPIGLFVPFLPFAYVTLWMN
jgi:hypothetical protein